MLNLVDVMPESDFRASTSRCDSSVVITRTVTAARVMCSCHSMCYTACVCMPDVKDLVGGAHMDSWDEKHLDPK